MFALRLGIASLKQSSVPSFKSLGVLQAKKPIFTALRSLHTKPTQSRLSSSQSKKSLFDTFKSLQKRGFTVYNARRNNNLRNAFLFATTFSLATYFAMPYIYEYTPMSYFKKHPNHFIYSLIGLNTVVFGLWYLKYRNVRLYRTLEDYFIMDRQGSASNLPMILSTFSHQEPFHLLVNMGCLYSFSGTMLSVLGVPGFTSLYLISGVWSSLASMWYARAFGVGGRSLGASGAIAGVFTCFATLFPNAGVSFFFFPIPGGAITAAGLFAGYNVAGCMMRWGSFDYAAHLGGMGVGFIWGWVIKKYLERKEEERRNRLRRYGF